MSHDIESNEDESSRNSPVLQSDYEKYYPDLSLPYSDALSDPIPFPYLVDTRDYRGHGAITQGSPSVFCLMFEHFESLCMLLEPISMITSLPHHSSHHIASIMSSICRKTI